MPPFLQTFFNDDGKSFSTRLLLTLHSDLAVKRRISLQGSMKRHVKYDNAQQGSNVGAKLPVQVSETHKSRL